MHRVFRLAPLAATAVFLFACGTAAAELILAGRVTQSDDGSALAGFRVGAVRWQHSELRVEEGRVIPEQIVFTDKDGRFRFTLPDGIPDIDQVVVFTCVGGRRNQIFRGVEFDGRTPTIEDLQSDGVVRVDLTSSPKELEFALPPGPTQLRDVMVPMRDGTRLATDIYLPEGKGPWPVILSRTPYDKSRKPKTNYTSNGYAVVVQDLRGRFASEGQNDMPFIPDAWGELQDGYDTIEWAASQPWCNGKVGTSGSSAGGITQVMTAGSAPPHLVCQFIGVAGASMYDIAYQGGVFRKADVEGWLAGNKFSKKCIATIVGHPVYDDLWRSVDAVARAPKITAPGLFVAGWYDVFSQGTIDAFTSRQYKGGQGALGKQKLVIGPWVHGRSKNLGQFAVDDEALMTPEGWRTAEWMDYWLKGTQNGVMDGPPVAYYVMGAFDEPRAPGNEWRKAYAWPVPSEPTRYYLHSDGTLSADPPPAQAASRIYAYDPGNPVPTRGGCNLVQAKGPYDQRPVEKRQDVLLYTSDPLGEPLEITGRIEVYLWASSSCRDTDFTVKLTDVYPDGRSVLVQDGINRARFRNSFEREELMNPGEVYRFKVDLWSTSIIFNKGHRIRVAVSSSNSPRFEPNPNTGDAFRANDKSQTARNTIYHDAAHPSYILLPVIRSGEQSGS